MSCNENRNPSDDFQLIKYRKRYRKLNANIVTATATSSKRTEQFEKSQVLSKIEAAVLDIKSSDLYDSVAASLYEGIVTLDNQSVKEIICLGLGRFGECMISRYQLSLLLLLKQKYSVNVKIYDPAFSEDEINLLNEIGLEILRENQEGKYNVNQLDGLTLFYLPHCPKQLMNNLLWANWSLKLNNCIIISNSFHKIVESSTKLHLNKNATFIMTILPYTLELAIINTFKYYEIFNDMAIHIFPLENISLLPNDFWYIQMEPNYDEEDVEFIRKVTKEIENK